MKKVLIEGNSDTVVEQVKKCLDGDSKLKHVTVFYDPNNFLLTNYKLLSPWVHMVLEFENQEIQIEEINCGYKGSGPGASVDLMESLGLSRKQMQLLVFGNTALAFSVNQDVIYNLNTDLLFYQQQPVCYKEGALRNKIQINDNVDVSLDERLVRLYNPQRTNWMGFLNLLSYMENIQMEYYIGKNSPLDSGIYVGGGDGSGFRKGMGNVDLEGTIHSNLYLTGDNFSVSCLIDREYEVEVIEAVYLALTGKKLSIRTSNREEGWFRKVFHSSKEQEIYERILINNVRKEREK